MTQIDDALNVIVAFISNVQLNRAIYAVQGKPAINLLDQLPTQAGDAIDCQAVIEYHPRTSRGIALGLRQRPNSV